ncbi:MAG TPA: alpha/beta hydrolase [Allosphingosinicella sp.]|nr:alpha/beta hydrolase [Allosphingosinicella sp.]
MTNKPLDRRAIPGDASLSTWRAPDGWAIRRMDWPAPGKARGSLLFGGGRGDFIEKYLEGHAHWRAQGWNVTAFDWRSQGGSRGDIEGGHLDSLDTLVDDLDGLIAEWSAATPGPHVAIAHSMGGHVLLRTLAERHPPLDAAVLVAPMLMINSAPLPTFAAWWAASLAAMAGLGRQPAWHQQAEPAPVGSYRQSCLTGSPERYEDELYWWKQEPGYNLGAPSWGWLKAAYASCAALTDEKLRGVTKPVLLLAAGRDRLVSGAAIRHAADVIPNAELVTFERSAHEILREADPIRLEALARIDAFLEERSGLRSAA